MTKALRVLGLLSAILALSAPGAARAESLPTIIVDDFTSTLVAFNYTGTPQSWVVPEGTRTAGLEAWGGRGTSDRPWGHLFTSVAVEPGETLTIGFGGPGLETSVSRGAELLGLAEGADGGGPSYVSPLALGGEAYREGGGEAERAGGPAVAGYGRVLIHYRPEPGLPARRVDDPVRAADPCTVPRLRGMKPRAARLALAAAGCGFGAVSRRPAAPRWRGKVLAQSVGPGTQQAQGTGVGIVVGRRP